MSANDIYNTWRAYYPWPGIYVYFGDKKLNIESCVPIDHAIVTKDQMIGSILKIDKKNLLNYMCSSHLTSVWPSKTWMKSEYGYTQLHKWK